jgi:pyruvate/2-oxoglutarate dehydrogenase complex dihydrolipoamide acyltransferase (E2) component
MLAIPPGLGFSGGTLGRWRVSENDVLGKLTVLCDLESDKACIEWTVRCEGWRVVKQLVQEGDEVKVGTALAEIESPATLEDLRRDDPWRAVPEED